ncbi:hypothetical protein M514_13226 [Trichuris suis]|uniref:Integrase catalytic domain-containing protein n=1 Tax=Trichuris suis TaxID=68888 RepID=A0A085MSA2_9BILA|nr:hypothetical protein M514_13226 [Trichuris suis]
MTARLNCFFFGIHGRQRSQFYILQAVSRVELLVQIHNKSYPCHPKTNGLAERAVGTFKESLVKAEDASEMELCLQRFLFSCRNTPHATTGRSAAELLTGRQLRNQVDLLKPSLQSTVDIRMFKQAVYHDRKARPRV